MNKLMMLSASLVMSGCNMDIIDLNFKFDKAHCRWPDGRSETIEIKQWRDYENSDQIQIITKNGRVLLFHSNNIVLEGRD